MHTILGRGDVVSTRVGNTYIAWFIRDDAQSSVLLPDDKSCSEDVLYALDKLNARWWPRRQPTVRDALKLIQSSIAVLQAC